MICAALDCTLWRTHFGRVYGPVTRQTTHWMTMKVSLYKDGQLKSVTDTWKWDMPKRHSERKIYQMKSHNISNEKDGSHFYFFFLKKGVYMKPITWEVDWPSDCPGDWSAWWFPYAAAACSCLVLSLSCVPAHSAVSLACSIRDCGWAVAPHQ